MGEENQNNDQFTMREYNCEQGLIKRADGSSRFSQGLTSIIVSVRGPCEVKARNELPDRAAIEVICKPNIGIPGLEEKEIENIIRSTFESVILSTLHPRTGIEIVIQILHNDGSLLSTIINGTTLALIDAGIPMRAQIGSITSGYLNGSLIFDPTKNQQKECSNLFTFGLNSDFENGVTSCKTTGLTTEEEYFESLKETKKAVQIFFEYARKITSLKYTV